MEANKQTNNKTTKNVNKQKGRKNKTNYVSLKFFLLRDGVCEGQFSKVLQVELLAIREACVKVPASFTKFFFISFFAAGVGLHARDHPDCSAEAAPHPALLHGQARPVRSSWQRACRDDCRRQHRPPHRERLLPLQPPGNPGNLPAFLLQGNLLLYFFCDVDGGGREGVREGGEVLKIT